MRQLAGTAKKSKQGGTCLTLLLNEKGTIEGEATIAKLNDNHFRFVTGGPSEQRVWGWITIHQPGEEDVNLEISLFGTLRPAKILPLHAIHDPDNARLTL